MLSATPLVAAFSQRFLRETLVFPYQAADRGIVLVIADPTDLAASRAAEIVLGPNIEIKVASFDDLTVVLDQRLAGDKAESRDDADGVPQLREDDIESLRDLASGAPVVRAVNDLLEERHRAARQRHPYRAVSHRAQVRMRVDGLLRRSAPPQACCRRRVISRIKIIAGLNIAERRLPQDGAARVARRPRRCRHPRRHHADAARRMRRDPHLAARPRAARCSTSSAWRHTTKPVLTRLLKLPHGMIVVTGPTGSGKTTTLATMLSILNEPTRKILTIEDPVEYEIPGVNQSQVKPAIGLTFATALRSFVRQDPDVIMVGEVRDAETAHVAIHAALTGHLVLTTLHTETAAAAVPRLLDLGIEGFLLRSTLRAVIAQRLVRVLCDRCKVAHRLTPADSPTIRALPCSASRPATSFMRAGRLRALRRHRLSRPPRRVRSARNRPRRCAG